MKIIRPLKYVLTAAAVCILCFSGNGHYIYTVFAAAPENDVMELPKLPEEISGKYAYKNSGIQKDKTYNTNLNCIILPDNADNMSGFIKPADCGGKPLTYNKNPEIQQLFYKTLHGNRSP